MSLRKLFFGLCLFQAFCSQPTVAQNMLSPLEHFGFNIGDDYKLANYTQAEAYFKKLAKVSNRMLLSHIGKTEENRDQYVMIISSPANLKNIGRYKEISQKLARAENLSDKDASKLAREGKAVVWIDGGLHANETVATQQLIEICYKLLNDHDAETLDILDNVIILLSQVNPDGQELMSNWYMNEKDVKKRNMNIPRLYQKYIGHDNNRDFYMNNMKESTNISRQLYIEWMPQIVYNHHQSSPAGTVVAGPPYRDPFNFVYDPLLITGIDGVGAAMINRLNAEGKPGFTRLSGSVYSTWWNGGLRTTPYFHNMIGILTEITGNPTPSAIAMVPGRLVPNNATPFPVMPQTWRFRQSIDYSVSLNYSILSYASKMSRDLLYNIYLMGRNSIRKGNQDNWTLQPKFIAAIAAAQKNGKDEEVWRSNEFIDARGYIIPANQRDFPTAVKFVNALIKSGILIHRATADFQVNGKQYPKGSYIVKTNQAFRPHVMDMFEPQDHPNDFQYPGGPPIRPYDAAGWTLAFQMGVEFDRIVKGFDGPFQRITYGELQHPPVYSVSASSVAGYLLDTRENNSFLVVNDLLKAGIDVYRLTKAHERFSEGSFYVSKQGRALLEKRGQIFGVNTLAVQVKPKAMVKISPSRVALFDKYGGSMPSGWVRWILEQFHYPFELIYPQDIDKGNLNAKYDVILFIGEAMPDVGQKSTLMKDKQLAAENIPEEFRGWLGKITAENSIPQIKSFLQKGGNVVTVGSSAKLAYHMDLPIENPLREATPGGGKIDLTREKYFIPGSILSVVIDQKQTSNYGMSSTADVVFNNNPVFKLTDGVTSQKIIPLAWFGQDDPLRSGWAWGQDYLKGNIAAFVAQVGKGKLYTFGPEITFRAQSHSTFKMLFNELYKTK